MDIHVSCVINAHREGGYLHRSIKSALKNISFAEKHGIQCGLIIILDNPSADTVEIADSLQQKNSDTIRIVSCDYGDLSESRNRAVIEAEGEFVAFLDGDDLWGESWISSAYIKAKKLNSESVIHPQYNIYFSKTDCHVMEHVSQGDSSFFPEFFHEQNYWTSLSFASKKIYLDFPYKRNDISDYFGYEDWTWNCETVQSGITHAIATNSIHFIRRGKKEPSLLDVTNQACLPRVYPLYNPVIKNLKTPTILESVDA